ncbi:Maf family protein [Luedemannella helvata]|uniref:Maf family protein n=1 Tax=Luedemannella helvata TaxID=349315 RepID=UPI003CD09402
MVSTTRALLVLASASPARLKTLRAAGVEPEVLVSGVDESTVDAVDADVLSGTLARLKAEAVAVRLRLHAPPAGVNGDGYRRLVLGCDSVLAFDGAILGKPADAEDARKRWHAMRGREGVLHTGHCVVDAETNELHERVARTTVRFADVSDAEVDAYLATGEPLHVAGAFTIDALGGWFVAGIDGDPGTVVGLSLPLLRELLGAHGVTVPDLWAARVEA